MKLNICRLLFFSLFILGIVFLKADNLSALTVDRSCTKVETIFARGSGQEVKKEGLEADRFFKQITQRLKDTTSLSRSTYELGTEAYGTHQYPAVAVNDLSFANGLGASLGSGYFFTYGDSVKAGVGELKSYLSQRYNKCQSAGTYYILGGYSQGAQVMGQVLGQLSNDIRNRIVFLGLFGDPKLHYPEGEGWNPPACHGKDLSKWRRAASTCFLDNGSLSARIPYLPDDMKDKTGLWCYAHDQICDPAFMFETSGHESYKNPGMAVDLAAQEAVVKLQQRLTRDALDMPPSMPKPNYSTLDVSRPTKAGVTGNNVLFIVDVSESMKPQFTNIQKTITKLAKKIVAEGGSYHVLLYGREGPAQPSGIVMYENRFFSDLNEPIAIDAYHGQGTPSKPATRTDPAFLTTGSPLYVFEGIARTLQWQHGATKSAITFTNNPMTNDASLAKTREIALQIDPVNFYSVVPNSLKGEYEPVAEATSGKVITYDSDDKLEEAADTAYTKIAERPVPFLKNSNYVAQPGEEVAFDASESYAQQGTITKYEWDFNGDGAFEATTTIPTVNHTYNAAFDGYMQVRLTTSGGAIANASAQVTIKPLAPPTPIAQPQHFTATVTNTANNKSTVKLSWQADPSILAWYLTINDMPAGHIMGNQTSIEITDVERSDDVTFGLAGLTQAGTSPYSTVTVTKPTSPPPITSTCTQSNIIIRLLCQTIAILKTYLNGAWVYILPYKL